MKTASQATPSKRSEAVSAAWLRALQLTAPIARNRTRVLSTVVQEQAMHRGESIALLSDVESFTYQELAQRMNQYARWAIHQGLQKGDVVCLLMRNRPEYLAIWLGLTSVNIVVALLNTNLVGASLAHCINAVEPKQLIVSGELVDTLLPALADCSAAPVIWSHGSEHAGYPTIDLAIAPLSGEALAEDERRLLSVTELALYIYTSGTTGLPKAARLSHARIMQWSHWFAGMMDAQSWDRLYNCLPLYHSVGGVQASGAMLVAGGSVVLREKFSARDLWPDIVRWECTIFQYIGELCRYLLCTKVSPQEGAHRIRLACGNGLAPDVWERFETRFKIPQILEFYASTEGVVSLFNVEGERGAVGRIPAYLAHRYAPALVRVDGETGEPLRNEQELCLPCAANQVGELLGRVVDDPANIGNRFEGYLDRVATDKKLIRDVFRRDDCWMRTGDLMRRDEKGFFYFVDRIGDTFRWKGENVATSEVSAAICGFPGVLHAAVYGVRIPAADGRVGMAAIVTTEELDLSAFRQHLTNHLPVYARPPLLRIRNHIEVTGTFKYAKAELVREGYNPDSTSDLLYLDQPGLQAFVPLDRNLYRLITTGQVRL